MLSARIQEAHRRDLREEGARESRQGVEVDIVDAPPERVKEARGHDEP